VATSGEVIGSQSQEAFAAHPLLRILQGRVVDVL